MGDSRRAAGQRAAPNDRRGRRKSNAGSFDQNGANMAAGAATRFKRAIPAPRAGDRFGSLTVVGAEIGPAGGLLSVIVRCDCGREPHAVNISNLRSGRTTRCADCAIRASAKANRSVMRERLGDKHFTRLNNRAGAAVRRCHNSGDAAYRNYGGRGIEVFEPWRLDRQAFVEYLATLPGWDVPRLEMDRIDVNGNYEPGNLRFITKSANRNNQRTVHELQVRIDELEARLRHSERGAAPSFYSRDSIGLFACA